MKKKAFLFDSSSCYINDEPQNNIFVVNNNINYTENGVIKTFKENIDISQQEINEILKQKKDVSTSLANPAVVKEKVTYLLQNGYEQVVYIPISCSISSTYDKCLPLMEEFNKHYGDDTLLIIRSNAVSYLANIVMKRFLQLYDGTNFKKVQEQIDDDVQQERYCGILFVNNVDQLVKGGRIKKTKATIVKAMNYKLLILMGKRLEYFDKALTYSGQINKAIDFFNNVANKNQQKIQEIAIVHDGLEQTEQKYFAELNLKQTLINRLNLSKAFKEIKDTDFPGVIKCHTGLNSLGIIISLIDNSNN